MEGLLPAIKSVAAGISLGGGVHLWFRSARVQRMRIRKTLKEEATRVQRMVAAQTQRSHFPQTKYVEQLNEQLIREPVGPVVLAGPEGAGTSGIAESGLALCQTPLLLHVNLRQRAASGDRPLFWQLVRSSGYYVLNREWADFGLGRFTGIDAYDIEQCMTAYAQVCRDERKARDAEPSRWKRLLWGTRDKPSARLPVLCIDEMQASAAREAEMTKLLRWSLYLTESRLAHVLLVCHCAAALELDQRYPAFRERRQRVLVDFPSAAAVRAYLAARAGGVLAAADAERVAHVIGGHWKDLKLVLRHRDRAHCLEEVDNLLADSKELVVRHWERVIDAGNSPKRSRSQRIAAYKRGLRFWAMAERLAGGAVRRAELAAAVFGATGGCQAAEIEGYLAQGLLAYVADGEAGPAGEEDGNNRLWVCAASPRLQAAFASLTADPLCEAVKGKAAGELARHEMLQRNEQLAARRLEQSAGAEAVCQLLRAGELDGETRAGLVRVLLGLQEEWRATTAELQNVRREYDLAKWKGRWTDA